MQTINIQYFKTPAGELILGSYRQDLCLCDWRYRRMRDAIDQRIQEGLHAEYIEEDTGLLQSVREELSEYFRGIRKIFNIPLVLVGNDFQKEVWGKLQELKWGQTLSYLELARSLKKESAIRAVAAANGANALAILIPCHRVLGNKGELTGYAGGIETKRRLLILERAWQTPGEPTLF